MPEPSGVTVSTSTEKERNVFEGKNDSSFPSLSIHSTETSVDRHTARFF